MNYNVKITKGNKQEVLKRLKEKIVEGMTLIIKETKPPTAKEFLIRFHAHLRTFAEASGEGYEYWYSTILNESVRRYGYPHTIVNQVVKINGKDIPVDVTLPHSTKTAKSPDLYHAYSILKEYAEAIDLILPENIYWTEN